MLLLWLLKTSSLQVPCTRCHVPESCRSGVPQQSEGRTSATMWQTTLATISAEVPQSLTKSMNTVSVDGFEAMALIDSGSSECFIHPGLVKSAAFHVYPSSGTISMATSSLATNVSGYCLVGLIFGGRTYPGYAYLSFLNCMQTSY